MKNGYIETYRGKRIVYYNCYIVTNEEGATMCDNLATLERARAFIEEEEKREDIEETIKTNALMIARELLKDNKILIDLDIRANKIKIKKIQVNRIY